MTSLSLRFIHKLRRKSRESNGTCSQRSEFDAEREARVFLFRSMQNRHFSVELDYLKGMHGSGDAHSKTPVPRLVNDLDLFLDPNGLIHSRGRISKCPVFDMDQVNPILVSPIDRLCELLIRKSHLSCQHLGLQATINHLRRSGIWVPRIRQVVKRVLSECILCRKFNAFSYSYPKMTNLPVHRTGFVVPFRHVGVDYTSHIWVNEPDGSRKKVYVLVYTCLNVRAVHLDLVPSMSTEHFLLSFKRFSNRFGTPAYLYSDNALSFSAGGRILEACIVSSAFESFCRKCNLKHVQIPLYSAWVGSCWERMIRTVKSCLYKVVGRSSLSYYDLLTTLSDIEDAVNSRPLTYRCAGEDLEPITPNSFLRALPHSKLLLRREDTWTSSPNSEELSDSLENQESRLAYFKRLWYDEYLLGLREHDRHLHQSTWCNRIGIGDVVLIKAPNKSRPFWALGRVVDLVIGFDNNIRSVLVKKGDGSVGHHSICNLYPLELSVTHSGTGERGVKTSEEVAEEPAKSSADPVSSLDSVPDLSGESDEHVSEVSHGNARPIRKAAQRCRQFVRDRISLL